jgi:hypothetical protein
MELTKDEFQHSALVKEYYTELSSDKCKNLTLGNLHIIIRRIFDKPECIEYLKKNDETFACVSSLHENGEKLYEFMNYYQSFAATIITQTYH